LTIQGTHNICIALEVEEYTGSLGNEADSNMWEAANQRGSRPDCMQISYLVSLSEPSLWRFFACISCNSRGSHLCWLNMLYESRPDVTFDEAGKVIDMNSILEERFKWCSKLSQLGVRAYEIYRPPLRPSPVYSCVRMWLLSLVGCFWLALSCN
jgi:hypothetical protein